MKFPLLLISGLCYLHCIFIDSFFSWKFCVSMKLI